MRIDMIYDGKKIEWPGRGLFRASSGLPGLQVASEMCNPQGGPLPEGIYRIFIAERGDAVEEGTELCKLRPGWGIQTIPQGTSAGSCQQEWANWGVNRARMEPYDSKTAQRCNPIFRGGFYLHDSMKGFSHGCIEVDRIIFSKLREQWKLTKKPFLLIEIKYEKNGITYGNTKL